MRVFKSISRIFLVQRSSITLDAILKGKRLASHVLHKISNWTPDLRLNLTALSITSSKTTQDVFYTSKTRLSSLHTLQGTLQSLGASLLPTLLTNTQSSPPYQSLITNSSTSISKLRSRCTMAWIVISNASWTMLLMKMARADLSKHSTTCSQMLVLLSTVSNQLQGSLIKTQCFSMTLVTFFTAPFLFVAC